MSKSKPAAKKTASEIYLDNNSHTFICPKAQEAFIKWSKYYNPSGDSKYARESREVIQRAVKFMHEQCGTTAETHKIIFTSGASESNSTILRSMAYAMKNVESKIMKPYIISSAIEHHNIIQTLEDLKKEGACEVALIKPNLYGQINPSDVEHEITTIKNNGGVVILISIMFANNETGAINNIPKIGAIADKHLIPLHTDAVQVFGKFRLNLPTNHITAMSASFHKLYGPGGIGLLVIENSLIEEFKITSLISGTQQDGLRGGTENVPAIAASMEATKYTFQNRASKNEKLYAMKSRIIEKLKKHYPFGDILEYILDNANDEKEDPSKTAELEEIKLKDDKVGGKTQPEYIRKPVELVIIGPNIEKKNSCLPNTILLAIAKNKGEPFCNVAFKHALEKRNVIVSIASACLTSNPKSSHVLTAMDLPPVIKKGVIRISLGDSNTNEDCDNFVKIFLEILDSMLKNMDRTSRGPAIGPE
jgi:cysteine desulfurase